MNFGAPEIIMTTIIGINSIANFVRAGKMKDGQQAAVQIIATVLSTAVTVLILVAGGFYA